MTSLRILLLGSPQVEIDGEPVVVQTRKATALLAYLAATQDTHTRDALATMLWPEATTANAKLSLRQTLWVLKKALDARWLAIERESVRLEPGAGVWVDAVHFERLLGTGADPTHGKRDSNSTSAHVLEEAVALYRDDFMTGFSLPDSPEFDTWQRYHVERLRGLLDKALERLVQYYSECRRYEPAIAWAQRRLALEPLQEEAHRSLMRLYTWAGRRADALLQYEACTTTLAQELGVPPETETAQLCEAIQAGHEPSPPPRSLDGYQHNLPEQATEFVGREEELAEITCLLQDPSCRLVTLLGPGGVGKTRLAIEAATRHVEQYPQGTFFVPLAPLDTADHIPLVIANALRLRFQGQEDPQTQLVNYLREKALLLVLDNFEHVLNGADVVKELLVAAPRLKIVATSRERLNLSWEWLLDMEGLQFPQDTQTEDIEAYDAVHLFAQRARRVNPRFRLATELRDVAQICRLVEGMPLAIELAAAQVREQRCARIAVQIAENVSALAVELRDVPARHRSLRAAFDHSWALLAEDERRAFRRLAVFRGGFEAVAAAQVAGASAQVLASLERKSLLRQLPSGRYETLEVLRQYGTEKLAETPEQASQTRDRHSAYFADFLRKHAPALTGKGQRQALDAIELDIENVHMAWDWAVQHLQNKRIETAMDGLFHFYDTRSWYRQGEQVFAQAVHACEQAGQAEEQFVWKLKARQSVFLYRLNYYDEARDYLEESLSPALVQNDPGEEAFRCIFLGDVLSHQGEFTGAYKLYQQALDKAKEANARYLEAESLRQLGATIGRGDHTGASDYFEQALAIYRELDNQAGEAAIVHNLGLLQTFQGHYAEAVACYEQSLHIKDKLGDQHNISKTLNNLGTVYLKQNDYPKAKCYFEQTLKISREIGDRWMMMTVLLNLGVAASDQGNYNEARSCYEQVIRLQRETGRLQGAGNAQNNLGYIYLKSGDYTQARSHFEEALHTHRKLQQRDGEAESLTGLALLCYRVGKLQTAEAHAREALKIGQSFNSHVAQANALTALGHILAARGGDTEEAIQVYKQALALQREAGEFHLATENLAGLAQIALQHDALDQALAYSEEILDYIKNHSLPDSVGRLWVYWMCYQVLLAAGDPRAQEILVAGHTLLQEQAAKIDDETMRLSFLENVPVHRHILKALA